MMLSVTVAAFIPTCVGSLAARTRLPAAAWACYAALVTGVCAAPLG
jgi:hypothetical protein